MVTPCTQHRPSKGGDGYSLHNIGLQGADGYSVHQALPIKEVDGYSVLTLSAANEADGDPVHTTNRADTYSVRMTSGVDGYFVQAVFGG